MQEKCTSLSIFLGFLELLLIDTNDGFPCKLSPEFVLVARSKLVPQFSQVEFHTGFNGSVVR